jgi:hypothetical protein
MSTHFVRRQASETAHFNRSGEDGILSGKLIERAIQFEQRQEIPVIRSQFQPGSIDAMEVATSFPRRFGAGVIDQDPSHHLGCNRQKMGLVGDIRCARTKHSKVDFID